MVFLEISFLPNMMGIIILFTTDFLQSLEKQLCHRPYEEIDAEIFIIDFIKGRHLR